MKITKHGFWLAVIILLQSVFAVWCSHYASEAKALQESLELTILSAAWFIVLAIDNIKTSTIHIQNSTVELRDNESNGSTGG